MAACVRLGIALEPLMVSRLCGCHNLQKTSLRYSSFLSSQQFRGRSLLPQSQPTCLVKVPHNREEMTLSKKRRKFVPHHEQDGVSLEMGMVYENNMNRYNFWGQLTMNTLALPIFGMSTNIIVSQWHLEDWSITSGPLTAMTYIGVYAALLVGVNGLSRRSIRRMYCDKDASKFAAVVQDWKFMKQTIHFDLSSVHRKPTGAMLGSFFGNLKVKGRSYLVSPADFVQPKFYNLLMGYDLRRSIQEDMIQDLDVRDVIRHAAGFQKQAPKEKKKN